MKSIYKKPYKNEIGFKKYYSRIELGAKKLLLNGIYGYPATKEESYPIVKEEVKEQNNDENTKTHLWTVRSEIDLDNNLHLRTSTRKAILNYGEVANYTEKEVESLNYVFNQLIEPPLTPENIYSVKQQFEKNIRKIALDLDD